MGEAQPGECGLSRRRFLRTAGAAGLALGSGFLMPATALAAGSDPKPIPGGVMPFGPGTELFHFFFPGPGNEPSTIFDFDGVIGIARIQGSGKNTKNGQTLFFDNDMRFMKGKYIGKDGRLHHGTFCFF
jgi:hypothetical protein